MRTRTPNTAGLALLLLGALAAGPVLAAAIPAWLDDGITKWNSNNPDTKIRFVDIKDDYAWFDVPNSTKTDGQRLREAINKIVMGNGYQPLNEEELVTTAKPPVPSGPARAKKCWSRSFVMNVKAQSHTKAVGDGPAGQQQNMLTSLVCEDETTWWAAFRVAR